jgi:hypothetical protein
MSLLEKIDRFNSRVQNAVDVTSATIDWVIFPLCLGVALIFAAWWVPHHYHWPSFHGWMRWLQIGLTVISLIGIWQALRDLVILIKPKPQAPPPTRPQTW